MESKTKIQGKTALVTGGARGIGEAIALRFAEEGCKVVICDILSEEANAVIDRIKKAGGDGIYVKADITKRNEVEDMVKSVEKTYGVIDIIVNNAGLVVYGPFLDMDEEIWEKMIATDLVGPLRVIQVALKNMIAKGSGNIVNIGSDAARIGNGNGVVYSACKGGVIALTKSLARELIRYNIRVNCVCPGPTETPATMEPRKDDPEISKKMARLIPMRRYGLPEEIAAAVLFLASDESRYMTGQTLSISGGITMM
ncbi:SDR family NAD(P)-dependent oxidoreductase [Thermodesulfobacteriota bacterium]